MLNFNPVKNSFISSLQNNQKELHESLIKIQTGKKVNKGSDNPSSLIAIQRLQAELESSKSISQQYEDLSYLFETADDALAQIQSLTDEALGLVIKGQNSFVDDDVRQILQGQVDQIKKSINSIATNTEFAGVSLLNGNFSPDASEKASLPDGTTSASQDIDLNVISQVDASSLGLNNIDFQSPEGAEASRLILEAAISTISENRGRIGALIQQLSSNVAIQQNNTLQTTRSLSALQDTDIIAETANLKQQQLVREASLKALKEVDSSQRFIGRQLNLTT